MEESCLKADWKGIQMFLLPSWRKIVQEVRGTHPAVIVSWALWFHQMQIFSPFFGGVALKSDKTTFILWIKAALCAAELFVKKSTDTNHEFVPCYHKPLQIIWQAGSHWQEVQPHQQNLQGQNVLKHPDSIWACFFWSCSFIIVFWHFHIDPLNVFFGGTVTTGTDEVQVRVDLLCGALHSASLTGINSYFVFVSTVVQFNHACPVNWAFVWML